ncbi:MAG: flagellar protein FliS [Proteobacteria bacterium]|nr:flagellar protein FliS [Pseudomonadota bacterium]
MAASLQLKAYTRATVKQASPEDTLLMLIREAVRSADSAVLEQDSAKRKKALNKSLRIVTELSSSLNLDYGGEMAFNMLRLYNFISRRLADGISGDDSGIPDALRILRHVKETWETAVQMVREAGGVEAAIAAANEESDESK